VAGKGEVQVGERLVELGVGAFHAADELVGFDVVRDFERGAGCEQGFVMSGRIKVLGAWAGPEGSVVEGNGLSCRHTENLSAKATVADGEGVAEVTGIVGRGRSVDELEGVPCARFRVYFSIDILAPAARCETAGEQDQEGRRLFDPHDWRLHVKW
jgi:hypothetical protein